MAQDPLSRFSDLQRQMLTKVSPHAGKLVWIGVLLLILGTFGILSEVVFSFFTIGALSGLLIVAGVLIGFNAFQTRAWKTFFIQSLFAILYLGTGIYIWFEPVGALQGLTLWLAILFLIAGVMRIIAAWQNWSMGQAGWVLLSGIISLLLGFMILNQWPDDSLWVPGMLLGIEFIMQGWTMVVLGSALKRKAREA